MPDKYTRRLAGTKISLFDPFYIIYSFLIPDLKNAIKSFAKGKVLDVGCGNKPYEHDFPESVTEYTGCDVEQSNLMRVDKICPATDLAFSDNSFDTVFCTQVLEHVFDHRKALEEFYRVLKPGGVFIGSIPFAWPHHEEPNDYFRFSKYGLTNLLTNQGWKIELLKANGGKWALLGQMIVLSFTDDSANPGILTKVKKLLFRVLLGKVWVNLILGRMDRISSQPEYWNTLNFVFVARKPV